MMATGIRGRARALYRLVLALGIACVLTVGGCGDRSGSVADGAAAGTGTDFEPVPRAAGATALVVFVHGVLGDAVTSFGTDHDHNWPALLATDPALGGAIHVLSLGYASAPIAGASNVNEIANRLLVRLRDREAFRQYRHVIFVAHSMGGLIVKRMLVQLRTQSPEEFRSVAAVFFIATPAGGSNLAAVTSWVSGNPQFRDMRPVDANTLLQAYDDDWNALLRARPADAPYPKAFCAYETRSTGPFHVVPRSAAQGSCEETPIAFDSDHLGIVKPAARAGVYDYVRARIRRVVAGEYLPLRLSGDLLGANEAPLPPDVTLRSGEQFAVRIRANKPAWFLVVARDSRNSTTRLYPSKLGGLQHSPGAQIRIPTASGQMLQLDNTVGVETIYVFASSASRLDLPDIRNEVGGANEAARREALAEAIRTRGLSVAPVRAGAGAAGRHIVIDAATVGAQAALRISIGHI